MFGRRIVGEFVVLQVFIGVNISGPQGRTGRDGRGEGREVPGGVAKTNNNDNTND